MEGEGGKGRRRDAKKDEVPVYLMVVKSGNWYWYSSVRARALVHTLSFVGVVVVASVVGCDAGVGLGLPNTEPTISKARLYAYISRTFRTHHLAVRCVDVQTQ